MKTNKLILDVHGNNELNRIALLLIACIYPQLLTYLGQKINTLNGKSKKFVINFDKIIPNICNITNKDFASNQLCYIDIDKYSIYLNVKLCFNGGEYENNTYYCQYFEKSIYLGDMENFTLLNLLSLNEITANLSNVINIDDEIEKIEKYVKLKNEADKIKNTIKVDYSFYKYL